MFLRDDRSRFFNGGGKSELQRAECFVIQRTAFQKKSRTESATENKQLKFLKFGSRWNGGPHPHLF